MLRGGEGRGGEGRGGEGGESRLVCAVNFAVFVRRLLRESATPPDVMESRVKKREEGMEG